MCDTIKFQNAIVTVKETDNDIIIESSICFSGVIRMIALAFPKHLHLMQAMLREVSNCYKRSSDGEMFHDRFHANSLSSCHLGSGSHMQPTIHPFAHLEVIFAQRQIHWQLKEESKLFDIGKGRSLRVAETLTLTFTLASLTTAICLLVCISTNGSLQLCNTYLPQPKTTTAVILRNAFYYDIKPLHLPSTL